MYSSLLYFDQKLPSSYTDVHCVAQTFELTKALAEHVGKSVSISEDRPVSIPADMW